MILGSSGCLLRFGALAWFLAFWVFFVLCFVCFDVGGDFSCCLFCWYLCILWCLVLLWCHPEMLLLRFCGFMMFWF